MFCRLGVGVEFLGIGGGCGRIIVFREGEIMMCMCDHCQGFIWLEVEAA